MRSTNALEWKIWALMNGAPGVITVILLYLVPSFAVDTFAWPVLVRASAVFLAASFLFRGALFLLIFRGVPWNRLRYFTWGNVAFASVLLLSTFGHADKFRFDLFTGWLWLFLYLEEPIWMVFLILRASRQSLERSERVVPLLRGFKVFLFAQALVLIGVSGFLLFAPETFDPQWPWKLTPLTGRIISGWPLSFGIWSIVLANMESWDDMKMGIGLNIFWLAAVLATTLVFISEFDLSRLATWLYLVFIVVALTGLALFSWLQQRRVASAGAH